jgi:hypothetical protein
VTPCTKRAQPCAVARRWPLHALSDAAGAALNASALMLGRECGRRRAGGRGGGGGEALAADAAARARVPSGGRVRGGRTFPASGFQLKLRLSCVNRITLLVQ